MKRPALLIVISAALIFLFIYTKAKPPFSQVSQDYDYSYIKVERVVDGDTIVLANGENLRYIGINTAELRRKVGGRWVYNPGPFAEDSAEFNRGLVEARFVRLEFDVEKKDKYGRLLAYVFLEDGTFVNAELMKQGYAHIMTIPPNVKYADLFLSLQREARENNRGLWGRR